jgi:hypothetical protein
MLPSGPVRQSYLSCCPARLDRLAESIPGLLKRLQIWPQPEGADTVFMCTGTLVCYHVTAFVYAD